MPALFTLCCCWVDKAVIPSLPVPLAFLCVPLAFLRVSLAFLRVPLAFLRVPLAFLFKALNTVDWLQ